MKPFKAAYKIVRENDNEIYKGFGFKHLSDATAYYVHRNNESFKGTTTLCQSIGEAVIFLAEYLSDILKSAKTGGEILTDSDGNIVWLDLPVRVDWRGNGVTDVFCYHVVMDQTKYIMVCPLDQNGRYLECDQRNNDENSAVPNVQTNADAPQEPPSMYSKRRRALTTKGYNETGTGYVAVPAHVLLHYPLPSARMYLKFR